MIGLFWMLSEKSWLGLKLISNPLVFFFRSHPRLLNGQSDFEVVYGVTEHRPLT